ncbi:MAG: 23S rRNA (adenine(2030)-N(6))-methyltransferase RlmJ [Neisseriaceae bacterium]|nr:23S rRNA (adenine(2030)-N(6))-methyltransferase RlmJ [Neisseriaceae bacterium]
MLSYRHIFHAGNFADILKHFVLFLVLQYYNQKDKPYFYIDTHSGAGLYCLNDEQSQKTGEYKDGFGRLLTAKNLPPLLNEFKNKILNILPDQNHYAGSPYIAAKTANTDTKLCLFEQHNNEFILLNQTVQLLNIQKRTITHNNDGFDGLLSLLPPPTRRAIILIDPSYEIKNDYQKVENTLKKAIKKFATGCYLIWYPILNREESKRLPEQLKKLAPKWLKTELIVKSFSQDGFGMAGSGMLIINPPYILAEQLNQEIPDLCSLLVQDSTANYAIEYHND